MITEAQKRASRKYDAKNTRSIFLKLNINTDADILEYLDTVSNKQGLIKELIRNHISGGTGSAVPEKQLIDGSFTEGEYVTVIINGEKHKRKVKLNKKTNDLVITVLGLDHHSSEFK